MNPNLSIRLRLKRSISLITLLLIMGCSNSSEPEHLDDLVRDFYLSDTTGRRTTSFVRSDDIIFNYMIVNKSEKSLDYGLVHTGPFVSFLVLKDTIYLGSTTDGYAFLTNAPQGSLSPGDTMWARHSWLPYDYHDKLSSGYYTAVADLHITFKDYAWGDLEEIEFTVLK